MKKTLSKIKDKSKMEFKELNLEVLQKVSDLMTAGFGLVAALAWNTAIKSLFDKFFPESSGLIAEFVYAAGITVIVVFITIRIGKLVNLAKSKIKDEKKEEKADNS